MPTVNLYSGSFGVRRLGSDVRGTKTKIIKIQLQEKSTAVNSSPGYLRDRRHRELHLEKRQPLQLNYERLVVMVCLL